MTETATLLGRRNAERQAAVRRQILDAAWDLMADSGVAALSVRELARRLGIRQQSLTYYFPTKTLLLDALFADGFRQLRPLLAEAATADGDPVERLVATVEALLAYSTAHPARYHLMLQRTVPGFTPSERSHQDALASLAILTDRLAAAGVTEPGDVDIARALINGLAAEQIANEPGGTRFISQAGRGLRSLIAGISLSPLPARSTHARRRTPPRPAHGT